MRMIGLLCRWTVESRIIAKHNLRICHFTDCPECGAKNIRLYHSETSDANIHKCLNCWEIVGKTQPIVERREVYEDDSFAKNYEIYGEKQNEGARQKDDRGGNLDR